MQAISIINTDRVTKGLVQLASQLKNNVIILRCVDTMYILITFYTDGLDTIREGCRRL